jgi:DNA-binding response OmpR family regulator
MTTPNAESPSARVFDGLRVLLAEDDESTRHMIRSSLKRIGVRDVVLAADGDEALAAFKAAVERLDLIVCDWLMPGLSGLDLLKEVRGIRPDMPFVMLTGKADFPSVKAAADAGVSAYITKPFTLKQLEDKLRAVIQGGVQGGAPRPSS